MIAGPLATPTVPPLEEDWHLYEFVDSQRQEKLTPVRSHLVANNAHDELILWSDRCQVEGRSLVLAPFRCFPHAPDLVRRPDVAHLTDAQLACQDWAGKHFTSTPVLAVEVVTPNCKVCAMDRRTGEWLRAGVRRVWIINPEQRMVRVHSATGTVSQWTVDDELHDDEVLPGFRCPAAALFALPELD